MPPRDYTIDLSVASDAAISDDTLYRYNLQRVWDRALPVCVWLLLNPSKADQIEDDLTIKKCMEYARRWGCGAIVVVNLYAFRSKDPAKLFTVPNPVGPDNEAAVRAAGAIAGAPGGKVIAGWGGSGAGPHYKAVIAQTLGWLRMESGLAIECLGKTAEGYPRHPSRLAYATPLEPFEIAVP